jgi:hypothetical protein
MDPQAANDNETGSRRSSDHQPVIEIIATGFAGRDDLLDLALAARRVMVEANAQLYEVAARSKSAPPAELKLIERELRGIASKHKHARDRFHAIEDTMEPWMRVKLWKLTDADGGEH